MRKFLGEILASDAPITRKMSAAIILFGVFLLAFLWLGLFYKVQYEQKMELNNAYRETANFARAFEEHTLRTIKGADQVAKFLEFEYESEGRKIDILHHIGEGHLDRASFVLLGVIDENGDLVASDQVPFVPSNLKDREHFLVHKNVDSGRLFISKPVLGRSSGKWSIQMTRRINRPDGSFGGVAVVAVDPYYFTEFYRQVNLGKNSLVMLVGRDGVVRARQVNQNAEIGQDLKNAEIMKRLATSDSGSYSAKSVVDGITRIYSFRALKDYPFAVVVGLDEAEVLQGYYERVVGAIAVTTVITAVILLFIVALLRVNARQKRADLALKRARDNLEAEVEQRTQDLFAANEELTALNQQYLAVNEELSASNNDLNKEVAERKRAERTLKQKNAELARAYAEIREAQAQLIQQEKMASVGQLAAGVAHEINNPMAFIIGNLESLRGYSGRVAEYFAKEDEALSGRAEGQGDVASIRAKLSEIKRSLKIGYVLGDIDDLIKETLEGAGRVKSIVQDLRGFARVDTEYRMADINEGIEKTINIIWNEIKYKARLTKELGDIPLTRCNLGQLNQVFMNILLNGVQAIESQGEIGIKTWAEDGNIFVAIADNGSGIAPEVLGKIFEPFFTTKEVGKGTGLGLSVTYDIVKKHDGKVLVKSEVGKGTTFTVVIPIVTE